MFAAIDRQRAAIDEAGIVGGKEDDASRDLGRRAVRGAKKSAVFGTENGRKPAWMLT